MPAFSGVDHVSFTVTDLDRSERFYGDVFDLVRLLDVGYARILAHRPTGLMVALVVHDEVPGAAFSEVNTGLDHVGFAVSSREELVAWESKLDALGVTYTPIRDMEFASHLNFRDPDGIALELTAPYDVKVALLEELRQRDFSREEIDEVLGAYLDSWETGVCLTCHGSATSDLPRGRSTRPGTPAPGGSRRCPGRRSPSRRTP